MLEGVGRLRGVRPRARAVAALRELGDERRACSSAPGPPSSSRSGCRGSRPATTILTPALARARAAGSGRAACSSAATADGDGFALDGTKWHVPFARAADAARRARPHRRRRDRHRPVPRRPATPPASTLTQQITIASDTQYEVELRRRARAGRADRIGAGGQRLGHVGRDDARRHRPPRRPRRSAARAYALEHHGRSTPRTASSSTSRSARSRRSPTTSPTPTTTVDGGRDPRATRRVGRATTAADRPARPDGQAVRRARPSATSPPWRSRSSAASASPSSTTSSSTSAGPSSSRSRWWDDRELEDRVAVAVLD